MTSPTRKKRRTRRATSPPPVADEPSQGPESFLDASAFPHLIDLIVSLVPLDVVPTLRLTCRHIRDRVDDLFPRQIAFENDGTVSVLNHAGQWVNGAAFHPSFVRIVDYRNTLVERTANDPKESHCKCAPSSKLYHRTDHVARVAPQLARVRMVRLMYDVCHYANKLATEVVDICVVIAGQQSPPLVEPCYIPPVTVCRKGVVNIRYPFNESNFPDLTTPTYELKRLVVMFTPTSQTGPSSLSRVYPDPRPTFTEIGGIVYWAIKRKGCEHVQIVGIEDWGAVFEPRWLSLTTTTRQAELLEDFKGELRSMDYRNSEIERYAAKVSFPSFDEYRTQVGDKQFAFEMGDTE